MYIINKGNGRGGLYGNPLHSFGEGNGNPLQDSCLENPMDREPGGLQSMGSQRVRHDLATKTTAVLSVQLLCKSKTILKLKVY